MNEICKLGDKKSKDQNNERCYLKTGQREDKKR